MYVFIYDIASSTSDLTSSFVSTRLHEVSDFPDPSDGGGKDNYVSLKIKLN